MSRRILVLSILTIAAANFGCGAGRSSLNQWQANLVKFVQLNKNDPNALRDATINNDRPGFGSIGSDEGPRPQPRSNARLGLGCFLITP